MHFSTILKSLLALSNNLCPNGVVLLVGRMLISELNALLEIRTHFMEYLKKTLKWCCSVAHKLRFNSCRWSLIYYHQHIHHYFMFCLLMLSLNNRKTIKTPWKCHFWNKNCYVEAVFGEVSKIWWGKTIIFCKEKIFIILSDNGQKIPSRKKSDFIVSMQNCCFCGRKSNGS